ncbi:MAG: DUF4340 domain-containing protein [bacterium]
MEEEKNTTENTDASMNQSEETNEKKSQFESEYNYVSVDSDTVEIKFEDDGLKEGEDEIRAEENSDMGRDDKMDDGGKFDYESAEDQDFNFRPEMVETKDRKDGDKMSTTYILLAIFLVLLGISYVIKNKSFNKEKLGQDNKIITNVAEEKIDKVEIKRGGNDTVIEKSGDNWIVSTKNGALADQEAVSTLIKKSLELNKYIIASENKDKQANFEVDDKGTDVILYVGDKKVADFFIGKAGPDFDSTYLRIAGEDVVYLSRGYVGYYFDKEEWRDLTIYDFDTEKVNKLALKYRDVANNAAMKKDGEIWKMDDASAKEANKDKVSSVLNALAKLKADDIIYGKTPKEAGFGTAALVVRLELEDGGKRNLIIGGKSENDGNSYYAKREEDDTIFVINKSAVDSLMKKRSDF